MNTIKLFAILLVSLFFWACNKDEAVPFDHPFFYIHQDNSSEVRIAANRNETLDYSVYFSGKRQFETINLTYEVVTGNGLQEGKDFEILTAERTLAFKPGVVEMPIQIRWIPNPIDQSKDNSVTIKLVGNSKNYTLGLPGPDKLQTALKFIKF